MSNLLSNEVESLDDSRGDAEQVDRVSPGSARSLLLTLLGEFVLHEKAQVWTATLLHVLCGVGIAEKAARQAIARAAAAGWIENVRDGRRASWTLSDRGRDLIVAGSQRLKSLAGEAWDNDWLILHLSLPETHRTMRVKAYRALSYLGFGNPSPALWVNPHVNRQAETKVLIAELNLADVAFGFVGKSFDLGVNDAQLVARAWDLDAVSAHYRELASNFQKLRPRSEDAILFAHVQLVNQLQRLPYIDPGLPEVLLPAGWKGRDDAAKLVAIRQRWHDAAHARWAALADTAPSR
ncbi:PaaX family transcriptional regulator C-terminal domain-containing protein [Burkholderia sp. S171]|uniref:PaaX family transcriptional regulator n=1 Tax=Burkholderia sp. S171 TaxID=1641860 RepID=UPI00131C3E07|nr:PaaX family transcriptional regulator C-terminal domain-containing protein [Burkholderia sp. S171]